jgi:hypothetical protein
MFDPSKPHFPTEILLNIFTDQALEYSDFFRFSYINTEWRSLIDTNDIRKLMFLQPLSSSEQAPTLPGLDPFPSALISRQRRGPHSITREPGVLDASYQKPPDLTAVP